MIPLRIYSEYSLLESNIQSSRAKNFFVQNNIKIAGICDQNNMFGTMQWSLAMLDAKIKPIIGCELKLGYGNIDFDRKYNCSDCDGSDSKKCMNTSRNPTASKIASVIPAIKTPTAKSNNANNNTNNILSGTVSVFCKNEFGYKELSNLLSYSYVKKGGVLSLDDLNAIPNCIILINSSLESEAIKYICKEIKSELAIAITRQIANPTDNCTKNQTEDKISENQLLALSYELDVPIAAAPKFSYINEDEYLSVDTLICIKNGTYLQAEQRPKAGIDCFLNNLSNLERKFSDIGIALQNTENIAIKCNFALYQHAPRMPALTDIKNPKAELESLVKSGLEKKLEGILEKIDKEQKERQKDEQWDEQWNEQKDEQKNEQWNEQKDEQWDEQKDEQWEERNEELKASIIERYRNQAIRELQMIEQMGFCDYFLIVYDIVRWAKNNNIEVGPGRGSGASSLVAWTLGITNIDPLRFNLMFERFLNPDRVSLPDFDIDFCKERRSEVVDYIQKRFGEENVAHIITFGSLQYRAAIRDVGRVMQTPYSIVDDICKRLPPPVQGVAPTIKELREANRLNDIVNEANKAIFEVAENIEGLPRHTSVHPAGVIIGNQKLSDIVPLYKEDGLDIPIIQFAMKPAEQIGLVKFDILGLAVLSVLRKTCALIKEQRNIDFDLDKMPLHDEKTFEMLSSGFVKGVFQVDSHGFRNLVIQLKPTCLEDLIAAGALYRPGPMQDIPRFIKCKNEGHFEYMYEEMKPILQETYSVIVYQEQILQIAKDLAGYSLKEADLLRRAMGKKIKSEMDKHSEIFVDGILKNVGGTKEKATTLFENLARFASYGFAKAHAAPYGLMTYQTAYLKANYTIEFFCSTMIFELTQENTQELIKEAKIFGIEILPPSVNDSEYTFAIKEYGNEKKIVYGLAKVKGIGSCANIVIEARKNGPFTSIQDFKKRVNLNKKEIEALCYSGALDCINLYNLNQSNLHQSNLHQSNLHQSNLHQSNLHQSNRLEQIDQLLNSNNDILLFEDLESDAKIEFSEIEKIKHEYTTMHAVFSTNILQIDLEMLGIKKRVSELVSRGKILALGIESAEKKGKDDKALISYKFIDLDGISEIFCNKKYDIKWDLIVIDIEYSNSRYSINSILEFNQYIKNLKKIFTKTKFQDLGITLNDGDTSIYLVHNDSTSLLGNYQLTLEFFQKMKEHILI